ncbi:MAG: ATP-binding protein [Myxococcales bacterium]|nr:ATP-binding protein [Myxococcales bacterium]
MLRHGPVLVEALFLDFSLDQRMETFCAMHRRAFEFFGGVPRKALYDNLKSVVLHHIGSTVQFNPSFLRFAGHYLFEPTAAPPRYPQAKGRVEGAIRMIRHSFFYGRSFSDLADLRAQAAAWRDEVCNARLHATTRERPKPAPRRAHTPPRAPRPPAGHRPRRARDRLQGGARSARHQHLLGPPRTRRADRLRSRRRRLCARARRGWPRARATIAAGIGDAPSRSPRTSRPCCRSAPTDARTRAEPTSPTSLRSAAHTSRRSREGASASTARPESSIACSTATGRKTSSTASAARWSPAPSVPTTSAPAWIRLASRADSTSHRSPSSPATPPPMPSTSSLTIWSPMMPSSRNKKPLLTKKSSRTPLPETTSPATTEAVTTLSLEQVLRSLGLDHAATALDVALQKAITRNDSPSHVLDLLMRDELRVQLESRARAALRRSAIFPLTTLDAYDFDYPERIDKDLVLRAASLDFLEDKANVVFLGPSGVGKTHLANALGQLAALRGYRVRFTLAADLVNDLVAAAARNTLSKRLTAWAGYDLLLIDELGYLSFDARGADLPLPGLQQALPAGIHHRHHQPTLQGVGQAVPQRRRRQRHRRPTCPPRTPGEDRRALSTFRSERRPARRSGLSRANENAEVQEDLGVLP